MCEIRAHGAHGAHGAWGPWSPWAHGAHGAHATHGAHIPIGSMEPMGHMGPVSPRSWQWLRGGACTDTVYRGGPGEASLDRISIATGGLGKVPSVMRPA